ncbi:hypothetical protein F0562_021549 [Nyssa sinensis]|uniref:Uncharacterized protein n=1 Tax=Nyssa sinensis TaxID=561372 RepID=A0A5J5BKN3_9ASTE|nr:hypothetical protein F0562_021549 [Nyssa sinensis]
MGHNSMLRSPKKEEQQVPDSTIFPNHVYADKEIDIMDDLEGIWGIEDEENLPAEGNMHGQHNWDQHLMDWEGFSVGEDEEEEDGVVQKLVENSNVSFQEKSFYRTVKRENSVFWDDDEEKRPLSLNLSLNYQEVMDAWSDRGSLWTDNCSLSMSNNSYGRFVKRDPEKIT